MSYQFPITSSSWTRPLSLTFLTAWHMLLTVAGLRSGETVLVRRGQRCVTGGDPDCRFMGARVLATAGSDAKVARAKEIGADEAINHSAGPFASEVKRLTDGRGVDVVVEHVGEATWAQSVRSLARGGRVVTCGATTGPAAALDLQHLFARQLSLLGSYMGRKGELLEACHLLHRRLRR
jgi:NADPH:quinone reductase-like Zn-dependent oxidoreductase